MYTFAVNGITMIAIYASKDAKDVYRYLIDPQEGRFEKENVILLRAEDATREAIKRALDEFLISG